MAGQTFKILLYFDGTNGAGGSNLITLLNGSLGGVTGGGGEYLTSCNAPYGCGTIFQLSPGPYITTMFSFDGSDGQFPLGLLQAFNGELYGTTEEGGANSCANYLQNGCGTVFKMSGNGVVTTIYNFCSQPNCADGFEPSAGLLQAANGDFYGTTIGGYGSVFRISSDGVLNVVYTFCSMPGCSDGESPWATLAEAPNGDLYGTTSSGGNLQCSGGGGCGTVFELSPAGVLTTLYTFSGDYRQAPSGLTQSSSGDLYGTTTNGGNNDCASAPQGCGTVFKITPDGEFTTLYAFSGFDGQWPTSGVIQATDGNLYGTTGQGGSGGCGTIFSITPQGQLTTLYSLDCSEANSPAGLVQATDGNFYGTTRYGGPNDCNDVTCGVLFRLSTGLSPFVKASPGFGKVGSTVKILGTDLTGATGVTFNGVPAAFSVVRSSEIAATVPSGATTGLITVLTPAATLFSSAPFRVH